MTLVLLDTSENCPSCGGELIESQAHEAALFRHGGYGATRSTIRRTCSECGWFMVPEVGEVRP